MNNIDPILLKLVKCVQKQKATLQDSYTGILQIIDTVTDINMKKIMIYYADDYMSQLYSKQWIPYMIENTILHTSLGGYAFFDLINTCLKEKQYVLVEYGLMMIKLGFIGSRYNSIELNEFYKRTINDLHHVSLIQETFMPYKQHKNQQQSYSFMWPIYIIILSIIIVTCLELSLMIPLRNKLSTLREIWI